MNKIRIINKEILEFKIIRMKLKNSLEGFNIRLGQSEEESKLKNWWFEDTCICIMESLCCTLSNIKFQKVLKNYSHFKIIKSENKKIKNRCQA